MNNIADNRKLLLAVNIYVDTITQWTADQSDGQMTIRHKQGLIGVDVVHIF